MGGIVENIAKVRLLEKEVAELMQQMKTQVEAINTAFEHCCKTHVLNRARYLELLVRDMKAPDYSGWGKQLSETSDKEWKESSEYKAYGEACSDLLDGINRAETLRDKLMSLFRFNWAYGGGTDLESQFIRRGYEIHNQIRDQLMKDDEPSGSRRYQYRDDANT